MRDLLADLAGLQRTVGFRVPEPRALPASPGSDRHAWDRLFAGRARPSCIRSSSCDGPRHHAPSTPGDLLFHIRAPSMDLCFELAAQIMDRLAGAVTVVDEVHGSSTSTTATCSASSTAPRTRPGRGGAAAVTIGDEDPDFAGGSYVIVQKYLHDLTPGTRCRSRSRSGSIGRTKLDDIELADDVKPANSHVALNTIDDDDGTERQILRDNMPFGAVGDAASSARTSSATPRPRR